MPIKQLFDGGWQKMKKYYVVFKGGKEQFITAKNPKEAFQKIKKILPAYEIVGYYEV